MKKSIIYAILTILAMFNFSACQEYTDITPKGKNTLSTAKELEYLMNYDFCNSSYFRFEKLSTLDNDMYFNGYKSVVKVISGVTKNLDYVWITYDESVDRKLITKTDANYEGLYKIITTRLNMILEQAPNVTDNPAKVNQLKAEALTLRAYLHYILVNIYAKAYNPSTAEDDGGIPYMNYVDFEKPSVKSTVAQVYENMLTDVNAALELNSLPDKPINYMRVGKGFAYAVKSRILLSMRNYSGALEAINTALTYNSTLEDHRPFIVAGTLSRSGIQAEDNLFFASSQLYNPSFNTASVEILNNYYEPGNIVRYYTDTYEDSYGYSYSKVKGSSLWYNASYEQNSAGMTTSDLYLIKAECLIRSGYAEKLQEGMNVINYIRERRISPTDYAPLSAATEAEAMACLKKVSRIELLFTWRNFVNIKRWNTEDAYKETITRNINGATYTLKPDSPLWIFPFPQSATSFNTNITQNY